MAEETTVLEAPAKPTQPTQLETIDPTKPELKIPDASDKKSFDEGMKAFGEIFTGQHNKKKSPPSENPVEPDKTNEDGKGADEKAKQSEAGKERGEKLSEDVTPPEHKPKPKRKAAPRQEIDDERIATIAAEAGARASTEAITRIEAEKSKTDKSRDGGYLPPTEYAEQYETFKVLAKLKPEKYSSIVDDFKKFTKEEQAYIDEWKSQNPGQTWDPDADEHSDFYERATPAYDENDFHKAEIHREVADTKSEIRKEVLDEVEPRLKELDTLKRNEAIRAIEPAIAVAAKGAMGSILKAIDPAYEKFVPPEELPKLRDENPVAFDVAVEVARDALPFVSEVTRLWKSNGAIKAEENNPLHHYIFGYASKMMELIKALPAEDQLRDGKKFATWSELEKIPASRRDQYWTVGEQDLIDRKLLDAQEIAKQRVEAEEKRLEAWAKRKNMSNGNANNSPPRQAATNGHTEAKALPAKENPPSPTVGTRTQLGAEATPTPSGQPEWMKQWEAVQTGRKL